MADRAQSEVLGFAVVFGIIVVAIALLTATGYGGLSHVQRAERTTNAGTAFEVLAQNVDELVEGAPSRTTELALSDGHLSAGAPVIVTVRGVRVGDPATNFTHAVAVQPLVYADDTDTRFVYATGAVVRADRGGVTMRRPSTMRLSRDAVVVPVVRTHMRDVGVGGTTVALVRTRRTNATLLEKRTGPYDVTVTVDSPRAAAWRRSLDARDGVSCGPVVDDVVSCTVRTDRVTVTVVDVAVSFE